MSAIGWFGCFAAGCESYGLRPNKGAALSARGWFRCFAAGHWRGGWARELEVRLSAGAVWGDGLGIFGVLFFCNGLGKRFGLFSMVAILPRAVPLP